MFKKRGKLLVINGHEAYVVRREGRVRIRVFRGVVSGKSGVYVISQEDMRDELRIFFFKKEVFAIQERSSSEESPKELFDGDLVLMWIEENSPVMYCLIVHSHGEHVESLVSCFKVADSSEMSKLLQAFLGSAVKLVNARFQSYEIEKALPICTIADKK